MWTEFIHAQTYNCKKYIELVSCIAELNLAGNVLDVVYKSPVINTSIEIAIVGCPRNVIKVDICKI